MYAQIEGHVLVCDEPAVSSDLYTALGHLLPTMYIRVHGVHRVHDVHTSLVAQNNFLEFSVADFHGPEEPNR